MPVMSKSISHIHYYNVLKGHIYKKAFICEMTSSTTIIIVHSIALITDVQPSTFHPQSSLPALQLTIHGYESVQPRIPQGKATPLPSMGALWALRL